MQNPKTMQTYVVYSCFTSQSYYCSPINLLIFIFIVHIIDYRSFLLEVDMQGFSLKEKKKMIFFQLYLTPSSTRKCLFHLVLKQLN